MLKIYLAIVSFVFVFCCNATPFPNNIDSAKITDFYAQYTIDLHKVDNPDLYIEIYQWLHKPYLLGGNSEKGIDCSNFVRMLYEKVYNLKIDGNSGHFFTKSSAHEYSDMSAEGDLIFFDINKGKISHVAIYLQHGKFAHVTVGKGVIISDINDTYWSKYFVAAARPQDMAYTE